MSRVSASVRLVAGLICVTIAAHAEAQTNTFPDSGSAGIGTTSPTTKLEVVDGADSVATTIMKITSGFTGVGTGEFIATGLGPAFGGIRRSTALGNRRGFEVRSSAGTSVMFVVTEGSLDGNVGIGTVEPAARLHTKADDTAAIFIEQSSTSYPAARLTGGTTVTLTDPQPAAQWSLFSGLELENESAIRFVADNVDYYFGVDNDDGSGSLDAESLHLLIKSGIYATPAMVIESSGNIGLGEPNPAEKLEVNGTIKAKEVIVTDTGWFDHVFADDYQLMSLQDTQAFIGEHGHLPDIPSADEVATRGVPVGEMQGLLLKKIEELTLYIFELQSENQALNERISVLEEIGSVAGH